MVGIDVEKICYFVSSAIGAVAFSNFVGTTTRFFPTARMVGLIVVFSIILIGLVAALSCDDHEEGFRTWFIFLVAIAGGVGLAFI